MNYNKTYRAFIKQFQIPKLNGQEKLLIIAAFESKGKINTSIEMKQIKKLWLKSLLKTKYDRTYYERAQDEDWLAPSLSGKITVKKDGLEHLHDILLAPEVSSIKATSKEGLIIFKRRDTHSFDKFLRGILAGAKKEILIADAHIGDAMFDTVLDAARSSVPINLMFKKWGEVTLSRLSRFKQQYPKFVIKRHPKLHDRFIIADNKGYVIGPSIKDAAGDSFAIVVSLSSKDVKTLSAFFKGQWKNIKVATK